MRLAPGVHVPVDRLTFSQVRGGGPGGQNVNNTSSKVELRLETAAIEGLSWKAQERLVDLAGSRLTADGWLIISCDETRSARTNKDLVTERLCELVLEAQAVPRARRKSRPSYGSVLRRLDDKSRQGDRKRLRRDNDH